MANEVNWQVYEKARRLSDGLQDQRPRNEGLRQIKKLAEMAERAIRNAEET